MKHLFRPRDGLLLPVGLDGHTAVMHPTKPGTILVYGGYVQSGQLAGNDVFSCDLATKTFSKVNIDPTNQATDWPRALARQAVVTLEDNKLLTVGGGDDTYSMEIHQLDLGQQNQLASWSCLYRPSGQAGEPLSRAGHKLAVWQDKLFLLGGGDNSNVFGVKDVPTFSLTENMWDTVTTVADGTHGFPLPRSYHSLVQRGEHVLILGGLGEDEDGGEKVLGDAWRLSLVTFEWSRLDDLPAPVCLHGTTVMEHHPVTKESKVVLFGGLDEYKEPTNAVYTAWLEIPSLRTMAWEAICEENGAGMAAMSADELLKMGVPVDLVEMLGASRTKWKGGE